RHRDQERHLAGGVHQPAEGARTEHRGGGAGIGPSAVPPDPDDVGFHGDGGTADHAGVGRGFDQPASAGLRHRRRRVVLDGAHAVRRAGRVRAPRYGARERAVAARRARAGDGGEVILALLFAAQVSVTDSVPRITLREALERAARLDPNYVTALGGVDNAEWGRFAALTAFIVPNVTVSANGQRSYPGALFNNTPTQIRTFWNATL